MRKIIGELWEIEGLLYLILAHLTQTQWVSWVLFIYGGFSIIMGFRLQAQSRMKD